MASQAKKNVANAELDTAQAEANAAAQLAGNAATHAGSAAKLAAQNAKEEIEAEWEKKKPEIKATFNQGKDADIVAAEEERRKLEGSA